jgi:transposase
MRGLLYEFGVVLPQGRNAAMKGMAERRSEIDAMLPELMIRLLTEMLRTLREIEHNLDVVDEEIAAVQKSVAAAKALREIPGFGVLGATACAAALGDGSSWRNARSFSATLGLCPSHRGTGGKVKMGSLSKRGDPYLRTLLISGARSIVSKANAPEWVKQMLLRRPFNIVAVALANKMARTAWALIVKGRRFSADWKSEPPVSSHVQAQCA